MLKRFRQEKAVWIKYGAFLLWRGQAGASHRVMQRALECLPNKERECSSPPSVPIPDHIKLSDIWAQGLEVFLAEGGVVLGKPSGEQGTPSLLIICSRT